MHFDPDKVQHILQQKKFAKRTGRAFVQKRTTGDSWLERRSCLTSTEFRSLG